jgi:hypothetical protein
MNDNNGQVEEVLERVEYVPEDTRSESENSARVPFPSDLTLTLDEEENLMDHCGQRIDELSREMGRDKARGISWWQDPENVVQGKNSWMGKRELFELTFNNDVEWRAHVLGGIFAKSNLVVPLSRRITRQMVARANNYFFATDPWFSAKAERGTGDDKLAEKIDYYSKFKLRQSQSKSAKEDAVEMSFIRGEAVMKSIYRKKSDFYKTTTNVLVGVDGEPVLDSEGGYIFENDKWGPRVLVDEKTGEEEVTNTIVLERDPGIERPAQLLYLPRQIKREVVQFEGAESECVYFKDFLCPLTAKSVQDADIVVHLYDMPLMDLAEIYRQREVLVDQDEAKSKDNEGWEATIRAVDLLRELANGDGSAKSEKNQQQDEENTDIDYEDSQDPVIEVAECHLYFDADGDGIREHIMVVMDRNTKRPIFYDYLANVTPDGKRPFTVIRPTSVDGRWYGVGAMEMFDSSQQIIDLLVNRWNHQTGGSGRVTFWDPSKILEGDRNPNLVLNDGGTYTKKPGVKAEDILEYVNLPDVKHEVIKNQFEFFLQMAMNESGVQHANDANAVGLDQAKLATGIRNIEKSGMEMFGAFISKLEPGIQETLNKEINLIFANLDKREAFEYFDRGDQNRDSAILLEIDPDEVRDMNIYVNVLLTRYKGEQMMQQASVGKDAVMEFYTQDPLVQERTAQFFRMIVKALDLGVDAEATIQPIPMISNPDQPGGVDGQEAAEAVAPGPDNTPEPNL